MTKTSFLSRGLLALAAFGLMAASACYERMQPLFDVAVATGRALKNLVLDGFKLAAGSKADRERTVLPFIQARAFTLRRAKRQRPEVSGSWRMCPST
jgi:hypothetical protein